MKKFVISMLLLLLLTSISYGAASEDVYLRKDVFDAKMDALLAEIRAVNIRIDAVNRRIDDMNIRIGDTQTMVYGGFTALGVLMTLLTFAPSLWSAVKNVRKPSITLEDVKRLIAESKLEAK